MIMTMETNIRQCHSCY